MAAVRTCCLPIALVAACVSQPPPEAPPLEEEREAGSVKGRVEEINLGVFDLVDGIAWPADTRGTVVYVTSKPIASSMLAGSRCPATLARALTGIRDAGWVEVTLDAKGRSDYFASGTVFGGRGRASDAEGRYVSSALKTAGNRVQGSAGHRDYGKFEFDLPLAAPTVKEVSESDRFQGREADASAPSPAQQDLIDAYRAAHAAARANDWDALLGAMGFETSQVSAIRKLPGIDADLLVFADRFLTPGEAGETEVREGHGFVMAEGANSKGAKFINVYFFTPCQSQLVLYSVGENPQ